MHKTHIVPYHDCKLTNMNVEFQPLQKHFLLLQIIPPLKYLQPLWNPFQLSNHPPFLLNLVKFPPHFTMLTNACIITSCSIVRPSFPKNVPLSSPMLHISTIQALLDNTISLGTGKSSMQAFWTNPLILLQKSAQLYQNAFNFNRLKIPEYIPARF